MKRTTLTLSALVALGLMAGSMQPVQAAAAAGTALPALERIAANASSAKEAEVVKVGHRDKYRKYRKWRRHPGHHKHWRHHRPRSGIYFHFGVPGPYYYRHRHVYPRYVKPRRYLPAAHVRWCEWRYKSYRLWDNSWQPYHGPRRQCRSPYN